MNEQTKELVKQSGFEISSSNFANLGLVWCSDEYPIDEQLEALVKLVRQDERESCAKLCELTWKQQALRHYAALTYSQAANSCADAIRARGDK
jgi:hypothetical protein